MERVSLRFNSFLLLARVETCPAAEVAHLPLASGHCIMETCDRKLDYKAPITSSLYTLRRGAMSILCPSLYCRCEHDLFIHLKVPVTHIP